MRDVWILCVLGSGEESPLIHEFHTHGAVDVAYQWFTKNGCLATIIHEVRS
jgi:hypothetical protein